MIPELKEGDTEPTQVQFAEAAAWVTRLHSPDRTARVERDLRRWLSESDSNAAAFEAVTAAWQLAEALPAVDLPAPAQDAGDHRRAWLRPAFSLAAAIVVGIGIWTFAPRAEVYSTAVGEQRIVTLRDGTRVTLNTDSSVKVKLAKTSREVAFGRGEAIFEVAPDVQRPFVVAVGKIRVRAVGTAFGVRKADRFVSVVLTEGIVSVETSGKANRESVLKPGDRLTLSAEGGRAVDRPNLDSILAWRRGFLDFSAVPLAEVADEMNRYSETKLIVDDVELARLPITGVFRTGNAKQLAAAVSRMYELRIEQTGTEIHLFSKESHRRDAGMSL